MTDKPKKPRKTAAKKPASKAKSAPKKTATKKAPAKRVTPQKKATTAKRTAASQKTGIERAPAKKAAPKRTSPKRVPKKQAPQGSLAWRITKFVSYWTAFAATLALIAGFFTFLYYSIDLPDPDDLTLPKIAPTVTILTHDGDVLTHRAAQETGHIAINQLPKTSLYALIAIEDRNFYSHKGVDVFGIARALVKNIIAGRNAQGGSTLTQQLAKMLYLKPEKKLKRKVQEAMLAMWLESKYDKEKLLEIYMNRAYFGAGAYGIEAASQKYFNHSARYLDIGQSALLAGLMKAPSRYNPLRHYDRAKNRQKLVLNAMLEEGYISQEEHDIFYPAPLSLHETDVATQGQYAADWIMQDLRGYAGDVGGDIEVTTTIDKNMQRLAQNALNQVMDAHGKKYQAEQAALILMDKGGAVRAIVGGRSYKKSAYNRAITAKRQTGSVFKPIVYLGAFERGYKPSSKVLDAPIRFKNWRPKNYKNKYYGEVTVTHSLARSMNSTTLRLAKQLGVKKIIEIARRLGIGSKLVNDLSIALGTSELSLLEVANSYLIFMNDGLLKQAHIVDLIRKGEDQVIYAHKNPKSERMVAKKHAQYMKDALYAVVDWGSGKRAKIDGVKVYGKTGTTQNGRDGWFVGFTDNYLAAIWVGNDDNAKSKDLSGSNLPAMIWKKLMNPLHQKRADITDIGDLILQDDDITSVLD